MKTLNKLKCVKENEGNKYYEILHTKDYNRIDFISKESIKKSIEFSYQMVTNRLQREYRSGGKNVRKPNEIFVNILTGKLSEYALYEYLTDIKIEVETPNVEIYDRGQWDNDDLMIKSKFGENYYINIKSTKHYGNLLLFEVDDYDKKGIYLPNNTEEYLLNNKSDFYALVRLEFGLESVLRKERKFYDTELMDKIKLIKLIHQEIDNLGGVYYDVPGYISHKEFVSIIKNDFVIKQGDFISTTPMDASNYYIQAGNLHPINKIKESLK